jgi:hypothetical protein
MPKETIAGNVTEAGPETAAKATAIATDGTIEAAPNPGMATQGLVDIKTQNRTTAAGAAGAPKAVTDVGREGVTTPDVNPTRLRRPPFRHHAHSTPQCRPTFRL